jgi:hypothetical protein
MTYDPESDVRPTLTSSQIDESKREFSAVERTFFEAGEALEAGAAVMEREPDDRGGLARLVRSRVSLGLAATLGAFLLVAGSLSGKDAGAGAAMPRLAIAQLAAAPLPAPPPAEPPRPPVAAASPVRAAEVTRPAKSARKQRHSGHHGQRAQASRSARRR